MGTLSNAGYIPETAVSLSNILTTEAQATVVGFTALPSELRTDLIQESVIVALKLENAVSDLMNGIAPAYANDFMFEQFAQSFGLSRNVATLAQVTLVFTGSAGTYIPVQTVCTDAGNTVQVTTTVDGIIGSLGYINIPATSTATQAILANTITVITVDIPGTTVNNPNAGTTGQDEETDVAFRARVQNTLSAPRLGSVGRAYELLEATPGVVSRLISMRTTSVSVVTS